TRAQTPPQCTDNACRYGILKAVRIANGNNQLTDPDALRIAKADRREIRRIDANDCEVGVGVIANRFRRKTTAIRKSHVNLCGVMNDVAVGQNEAVGREDKSRTAAAALLLKTALIRPVASTLLLNFDVND